MKTQVAQWGNSLAVRIPVDTARRLRLRKGTHVEWREISDSLVLTPGRSSEPSLDELLAAVTERNLHGESSTGRARGAEAW